MSLAKDIYSITNILIQTERNGVPDMIITAHQCIYNTTKGTFSSEGELSVRTGDERLALQGRGFLFLQRESHLIVSNDVQTVIRWRSISGRGGNPTDVAAVPGPKGSGPAAPESEIVRISSQQLDYRPELALFEHKVHAAETNGLLRCEKLIAHFVSNRVERIEVEQNILIEQGATRATGDQGTFTAEQDKGVARLIGHATWRDEQHSVSADTLVMDRVRNIVRCEGQARMKLPRQSLSQPGALFVESATPTNRPITTNQLVELSSDLLLLQLPPAHGPVRRIERVEAERNVTVSSPADGSRATGQKLTYEEANGLMELSGNSVLQGQDYLVKGDTLVFDRTNHVFSAHRNAYVRVPMAALGTSSLVARDEKLQKSTGVAATNQFVEVFADEFERRTNRMDFRRNVRAHQLEAGLKRAEVDCPALQINFGQRIESILASGGVIARQFPSPQPNGTRASKELSCATLKATMNTEGRLDTLLAEQNVRGEQTVTRTNKVKPTLTRILTDRLTAQFAPQTNQVQTIVAERNVRIEDENRTALGDKAVFNGENHVLELTGNPTAISPEGKITEADVLLWDSVKRQLRVKGKFRSEWQRLSLTNSPSAQQLPKGTLSPHP